MQKKEKIRSLANKYHQALKTAEEYHKRIADATQNPELFHKLVSARNEILSNAYLFERQMEYLQAGKHYLGDAIGSFNPTNQYQSRKAQ